MISFTGRKKHGAKTTHNLHLSEMLVERTEDAHIGLKKCTIFLFLQNIFAEYIMKQNVESSKRCLEKSKIYFRNLLLHIDEPDLKFAVEVRL